MYTATTAPPNKSGMHAASSQGGSRVATNGMTSRSVPVNSDGSIRQMAPHVMYPPHSAQRSMEYTHAQYIHQQHMATAARMANALQVPRTMDAAMASRHLGLPATPGRPTSTGYLAMPARASNSLAANTIPMTNRQRLPHPSQVMENGSIKQVPTTLSQATHPQATHQQVAHPQASHPQGTHPQANHPQANHPQTNHPHASHPQAYSISGPSYVQRPTHHSSVHPLSHARTNSVQGEQHHLMHRDTQPRFANSNVTATAAPAQGYVHSKGLPMSVAMSQQQQRMTYHAQSQVQRGHHSPGSGHLVQSTNQGRVMSSNMSRNMPGHVMMPQRVAMVRQPTPNHHSTNYSATGHPTNGQPSTRDPSTSHATTGHPSTIHPTTGYPSTSHHTTGHPATGHLATSHQATGHLATGHPASGQQSTSHLATGYPATGHLATGHLATSHPATSHPATNHNSPALRSPHGVQQGGVMGPARPRPPMPPLIKAPPPEPAQTTEDAPLDLSNPDGPLDLSVKSRKRPASPANSQDDVILVKVSQPKVRRLDHPPPPPPVATAASNYPSGYAAPQSKYPHETVYNAHNSQIGMNGKLAANRRLSQASPHQQQQQHPQMMMSLSPAPSIVKGHPGIMQHHMMQRHRHPGPQQMSPVNHYDSKWRMASPQPKDLNGKAYMTQGHVESRVDAKRQSEELIRNAFNMRFANSTDGYKRIAPGSHDNSSVPAHSNGFSKPAENQPAQHSQPSPRLLSEYRPLMQAGQPRTLEEMTTNHIGRRPSLVTYNASPHALLQTNSGYVQGSITQGLPMTERGSDQRGPGHQTTSPSHDFSARRGCVPASAHSAPHNHSEYGQNYVVNKDLQGHHYPHSIQTNARSVVNEKPTPQSSYTQSAHAIELRSGPVDVRPHSQSHPFPQNGSEQPKQEVPSDRRASLSSEASDSKPKQSNQVNIIRIMHDFIENRIDDPCNMELPDTESINEAAANNQPKQETSDQPLLVSKGLPSGVRFHPSPEGVPRAPFKGERSHPDRTIPVANVNPILQSNNPLLHPKKQMLYQSRLESSRKETSTPIKEDDENVKETVSNVDSVSSSPGATCDTAITEKNKDAKKIQEASKAWRKMHMVPIKERFKSKKMYNKEQALQSIKSDGSKVRSKVPGRKPGRPRSVAPLMKKATKTMKQQMLGRPGKCPGNDITKSRDGDSIKEKKSAAKSEFDFVSNEKEENEDGKDTKNEEGENRMKKKTVEPPKRGRPRTRPPEKTSDLQEEKVKKRKGKRKKEQSGTESGSETRSRRGLHKRDLTVLTRHQAANLRSTRRGTLYNKNEAYEKELRRDEYRKFLLRIKRQTSWSEVSSHHKLSRGKHRRRLRPRNPDDQSVAKDGDDQNASTDDDDDDDARDADYDDTDLDDLNTDDDDEENDDAENDGDDDDDDTELASDAAGSNTDLPKRATNHQQRTERRKRKYRLRRLRRRIQDEDSDDAMSAQTDDRGQLRQPEVGQEVKAEVKKFVVNKDIGETLLHRAAKLGNMELLMSCLQSPGVNVNARDNAGYTPLHESCVKGHIEVTRILVARGADVNANAIDGTRPIHDAVDNERFEIARLLLSCGADIRLASVSGRSVLKVARTDRMKTLIKGYLHDLNGPDEEEDEGEEPAPWTFHASSSILGRISNSGFDVLADVPSESEGDDSIVFDLNDKEHLSTFNLCLDNNKGYRNYHRLEDVLSTGHFNSSRKSLNTLNLTIIRVERHLVVGDLAPPGVKIDAASSSDDMMSFVEIDDTLLATLGVERFRIHNTLKWKSITSPPTEISRENLQLDGVRNNGNDKPEAPSSGKNINKSVEVCVENDLSHGNNVCQSDKVKQTPSVKQEVAPSTVSPRQEVTSQATSPKARSLMPANKAATVPAKLHESRKETLVKSVSVSALDKYNLKGAYGMWNIRPCSVPIQNSGASLIACKSAIVAHSQDKYSVKSEVKAAKFQTKITDYDKLGKPSTNEMKSIPPVKAMPPSPHNNGNSPTESNCSPTTASNAADKIPDSVAGNNVNATASCSTVQNNVRSANSSKATGNEMDNVSTSASTISSGSAGSNMIKTEIKIGTVPEDCLAELAQVANRHPQSCGEQGSVSPREAATPTSAQIAVKPEPRPSSEDPSDLPVLEKESSLPAETVKEEKPTYISRRSVSDDREMPELTIEESPEGEGENAAMKKTN